VEIVVVFALMVLGYAGLLAYQARLEVRRQRVHAEVSRARLIRESARW
jgi:hypothetical protein